MINERPWTKEEKQEIKDLLKKVDELEKKLDLMLEEAERDFHPNEKTNKN